VPELREAIREEEAALAADGGQSKARSKRAKGNKAKADDAGDKPDGRAGPRSENVVLSKSKKREPFHTPSISYLSCVLIGKPFQ
jgi:hypothetical protein